MIRTGMHITVILVVAITVAHHIRKKVAPIVDLVVVALAVSFLEVN